MTGFDLASAIRQLIRMIATGRDGCERVNAGQNELMSIL
jgi:hypothetical protein